MGFLDTIFGKKEEQVKDYDSFWRWFGKNEKQFYAAVKNNRRIEEDFFDKLSPKLAEIKDGYFFLAGMRDSDTAELIITADGNLKNMVFVEELVEKAPDIKRWKFTAHKPRTQVKDFQLKMGERMYSAENMFFYANNNPDYPDDISLVIIRDDITEENQEEIGNGVSIFLDNLLGELASLEDIDELIIASPDEVKQDLIPISKLRDYIIWRQKEFVEKYEGTRYNTEKDEYVVLTGVYGNRDISLVVMNTTLLKWDRKASHPWIAVLTLKYEPNPNDNGPESVEFTRATEVEDELKLELKDKDGYLNVGREVFSGRRYLYFACKDFRKPAKVFYHLKKKYSDSYEIEYEINKDKYWTVFDQYKAREI